jgi:phosphate transport system permease protein
MAAQLYAAANVRGALHRLLTSATPDRQTAAASIADDEQGFAVARPAQVDRDHHGALAPGRCERGLRVTVVVGRSRLPDRDRPRLILPSRGRADRAYRRLATGAGLLTLVILVLIGAFLVVRSLPAFEQNGLSFFTTTAFQPDAAGHHSGILAVLYWTAVIALIGIVIALPISIAVALFINEYAPLRIRRVLTGVVDLLAAIPSVIYGIWGLVFFQTHFVEVSAWLAHNLGFIPIFHSDTQSFASSALIIGCVLALMIVPICTSVIREVFSQTPPGEKEAALALGSSRWGMIRSVVLPFGRGGIVGGAMLGLGRALGETIAVALIVSPVVIISPQIVKSGANSVAALIALQFSEASQQYGIPALMAAGLSLFVVTLVVNFLASIVVGRSRSGKGVEA